ncbi:unnamed protein product [Cladocopium goreaui]|uniref:Uncharacterized protein n=1 Tax=Cladocopium goreaui TaxID=2562237 RepID=A0A9P1BXR1_9DINO|nr:unnamed protein product [Cladocopium goreaui]
MTGVPFHDWTDSQAEHHPRPQVTRGHVDCKMHFFYLEVLLTALPVLGLREISSKHLSEAPKVPPVSRAIGSRVLDWPAEDKPWHNGGQLGMQVELAFGSWMMWPLRKAFESTALEAVKKNIVDKVGEAGVKVDVKLRPMLWSQELSGYVLPLFIGLRGISDFDDFNRENLESVKATLLQNSLEGEAGPGGVGYATDAEPMEVRMRNQVGDALKSVSMRNVSSFQLQLDVQFWTEPLLAKESAEEKDLPKMLWEKITGEYWRKVHDSGIDLFIASPEYTEAHLHPRVYGFGEARSYSTGGTEKCVFAPDFQISESDDGKVSFYHSEEKKVLGVRAVITVISVNENFSRLLPSVRDEMMPQLMKDLPGALGANEGQSSCTPCGWSPSDPRLSPLPHDSITCGPLPRE